MSPATPHSGSSGNERPYHHGQLAEALLEAAIARAREGGPRAIGLREVTRDVGVTPRAAYRHYADRDALVRAVSRVALRGIGEEMARRLGQVVRQGSPEVIAARDLAAIGEGYVAAALAEPGLFETALFGLDDLAETRSEEGAPPTPYERLQGAIAELVRLEVVSPGRADVVAATCWSTVHGFATLATQGPMRELPRPAAMGLGMQVVHAITRGITGVSDLGVRTPIEMPAGRAPAPTASPPEGDPSGEPSGG